MYATVEAVRTATGNTTTFYDASIARAIASASQSIDGAMHRTFWPTIGTRYLDWPQTPGSTGRLWLGAHEAASLSQVAVNNGATVLPSNTWFLRRSDEIDEAPYDQLQIDLGTSGYFSSGTTTQRAIVLTGTFCGCPVTSRSVTTLAEDLDTSETAVDVADGSGLGTGSLVLVGTEYMQVVSMQWLDSGQNLAAGLDARNSSTTLTMTGAHAGETLLVDGERMRVIDVAGTTVVVERSTGALAAHSIGADIYVLRTLNVTRGAQGSTAATHLSGATVGVHPVPELIESLAIAEAIAQGQQDGAAWARTAGTGDNQSEFRGVGLRDIRDRAKTAYGRMGRFV